MARMAKCVCGGLVVTCTGEPKKVSLCHCQACQRRTGSSYGVAAFFDREDVRAEGPSKSYSRPSDKGFPVDFHFCPNCGSTVYWEPQRMPNLIAVGIGAFADPSFPAPTQAVYTQYRHPWVNDVI
ncbi:MAG: GFA family protein [Alphaproteobacteria bacterium]|nr:GFA family protein [Alphaproteobacteria bacterium]